MVVGLIDEHGHVLRDIVQQLSYLCCCNRYASWIIRITEEDKANVAVIDLNGADHLRDVLTVVLHQR